MSGFSLIFALPVIICIWLYTVYTGLIQKRNRTIEAFASIDVQLKKRYDLIPNILTIAQKYMDHERNLLEEITKLRTEVMSVGEGIENIDRKIALENQIAEKMNHIKVAMENYPEIKADQTMITAMQTYNEVEEHIAAARRFYNSAASDLKNAVEIFPSSVFASMLNIKPVDFFKAQEVERQNINAADFLK